MEDIEVSVIVPLLNEEKYIEKCILSLIDQTYPKEKMEWIFIDGKSKDKTVEIIEKYKSNTDYPISLLLNEKHTTPYALNMAIDVAKGEYIIRLDAHAKYENDYIEKCVFYLQNTDADNVGGFAKTDAKGFVGKSISKMLSSKFGVGDSQFRTNGKSGYVDTVPFGAFKREVFDRVGGFNTKLLRSEDNDLNARIRSSGGKIYLAEDISFTYYCRDTVSGILKMGLLNGNALFPTLRENRGAMSLRHFIPFMFVLSLVIMPIISCFVSLFWHIFALEIGIYSLLNIFYSFINKDFKYGFITIWLYPVFHIAYGIGSLIGLCGKTLY